MARFDFPVSFASIEGYTDNTAQDGDLLIIQAFDAVGNFLGQGQDTCSSVFNPNPPPAFSEGVCVAEVSVPGIRRVEVIQGDIDALDTLTLRPQHEPPDLVISKDDGQTTVQPGETLSYVLTISNVSNQDATGVVVSDTLPANTSFVAASNGGSEAGGVVTWPAFNLAAGVSVTRAVTVQVDDPLPTGVEAITNSATVADDGSNGADPTPGNNTDTDTDSVEAAPDLVISKDDGQTTVQPGEALSYVLTISNVGNQEATGVVVSDTLPANTTFVAASNGGSEAGGLVTWPAFNLAAGASTTRAVTVQVDDPLPAGVEAITNTAAVADDSSNGADPAPGNNTDSDTDSLLPADLAITKSDAPDPVNATSTLTYTLKVTNNGPADATSVILTDTLPAEVSFVSASPGPPTCQETPPNSGTVRCNLGSIASGANTTVSLVTSVAVSATGKITNTATVTATQADQNPADNTAQAVTTIRRTAISLVSFTAQAGVDSISLNWETASEINNEGFNLWRSETEMGQYIKINPSLIPATGNSDTGASYEYVDSDVVKGVTYYYRLEDLDTFAGSAFHGPVSATPGHIRQTYLPVILK